MTPVKVKIMSLLNCEVIGAWRSLVAHLHGVQVVGGSNPLAPIRRGEAQLLPFFYVLNTPMIMDQPPRPLTRRAALLIQ